ncbi:MAG: hypothetical protein RIT19_624 [Verrucomicrobiota bacterium]|jgi:antitoxin (DNA-binding transcriptional repressor) of toxin-antitoxin stability system
MTTATVRDLEIGFPRVAAWIENGQEVVITKAGRFFARLVPAQPAPPLRRVKPDIMARLRKTWGDQVFSAQAVEAMRAAELEGEEG